jgi:hypothetical protein
MTDRKTDNTGGIGLKKITEIGVPKAEKESWAAVAKRLGKSDTEPGADGSVNGESE